MPSHNPGLISRVQTSTLTAHTAHLYTTTQLLVPGRTALLQDSPWSPHLLAEGSLAHRLPARNSLIFVNIAQRTALFNYLVVLLTACTVPALAEQEGRRGSAQPRAVCRPAGCICAAEEKQGTPARQHSHSQGRALGTLPGGMALAEGCKITSPLPCMLAAGEGGSTSSEPHLELLAPVCP